MGVGDADHADGRLIPKQARIKFGDPYIKRGAQPVFQTARDLALVFKGLRRFNTEFEREERDHSQ